MKNKKKVGKESIKKSSPDKPPIFISVNLENLMSGLFLDFIISKDKKYFESSLVIYFNSKPIAIYPMEWSEFVDLGEKGMQELNLFIHKQKTLKK